MFSRRRRFACSLAVLILGIGCSHTKDRVVPPPGCDPTYSQYHLEGFRWTEVGRVLVLPLLNESNHPRADEEIGRALRTELQQLGRFEVVAAEPDDAARYSRLIHKSGRFDEDTMLRMRRAYGADVIIHGTITEYSAYPRPRIGIDLQAVAPAEAKVVASVDGLWDANHLPIAKRAQSYYLQRKHERGPHIQANWIAPDDGHADELALLSPMLYQRWVSSELVALLVQDPTATGVIFAPHGTKAVTPAFRPPEFSMGIGPPPESAAPPAAGPGAPDKIPPAKNMDKSAAGRPALVPAARKE